MRSSYLSSSPPLREQLKTRTDELEKLRADKTRLETELATARKAASAAASAPVASTPPPPVANAPAPTPEEPPSSGPPAGTATAEAAPSNPPMFASDGLVPSRPSWLVAIAVSLLTLIAGFVLGWRVLDKRIRAKYGGLRIY
jgi:hypothetical protein